MTSKIIGITGKAGAGKTTLVRLLASTLNATVLFWDDFTSVSGTPNDLTSCDDYDKNYNELGYQKLFEIIDVLKANKTIIHPTLDIMLIPTKYIIFETPYGRLHPQANKYIDNCIHIDVPIDVLFARRMMSYSEDHSKTKQQVLDEINFYFIQSKSLLFDDKLKYSSDFVINGILSTQAQVLAIKHYLRYELYKSKSYKCAI